LARFWHGAPRRSCYGHLIVSAPEDRETTTKHPFSTRKGRRLREAKLRDVDYLCERCRVEGRLIEAMEVHHRVPLHEGGDPFPPLNGLEALCDAHHKQTRGVRPRCGVDPATGLPLGDHWWNDRQKGAIRRPPPKVRW
jgi:5-methylcytosine-specific restriction enzyme A